MHICILVYSCSPLRQICMGSLWILNARVFLEILTVLNVETKSSSLVKNNKSVVLIFEKYNIF